MMSSPSYSKGNVMNMKGMSKTLSRQLLHLISKMSLTEQKIELGDNKALTEHPEVVQLMKSEIERLLPDLADFEKICKFLIIREELTIENDTPHTQGKETCRTRNVTKM